MSEMRKFDGSQQEYSIDIDSMLRDVLKQFWVILLVALSAALLVGAYMRFTYKPVYEANMTFVVGKSGFNNNLAYENLNSAENVVMKFSQIATSSVLERRVCSDLGLKRFDAEVRINSIESSNLMTLSLTAPSPDLAYRMIHSVMNITMELSAEMMDSITFKVLQPAVIPQAPKNPLYIMGDMKKFAILAAGMVIVFLALRSYFKDTIRNQQDAKQKVDTRLIGSIAHENKRKTFKSFFKNNKQGLSIENILISFDYVESVRMAATRVRSAMDRRGAKIVLVTSLSENEGKSTVASNLALALAQEDCKVALVDCDFRKPSQYKLFELSKDEEKNFVKYLCGEGELSPNMVGENKNVELYCSRTAKSNFITKSVKAKLKQTYQMLLTRVDYVIMDTSPMALVSDGEELGAVADCSLLVVQQDVMEAKYINDTIDQLNRTNAKVLGFVFNNVRKGIFSRAKSDGYYGTGYHYKSRYGKYNYSKKQEK